MHYNSSYLPGNALHLDISGIYAYVDGNTDHQEIYFLGTTDQLKKLIIGQYFLESISISCTIGNIDPGYPIFARFLSDL